MDNQPNTYVTSSPAPQSTPPVSTSTFAPTPKSKILPILFTILLLAVLAIAGYFGYQNLPAVKADHLVRDCLARGGTLGESYPIQCFPPTPTPSITELQIFNSQGVEFAYPAGFSIQPGPGTNLVRSSWDGNSGFGVAKTTNARSGSYQLTSMFTVSNTKFYSKDKSADNTATQCFVSVDPQSQFIDTVTINGQVFKKSSEYSRAAGGTATQVVAYRILHNESCWDITLTNETNSDWNNVNKNETNLLEESAWKELNQILSTFKFVD